MNLCFLHVLQFNLVVRIDYQGQRTLQEILGLMNVLKTALCDYGAVCQVLKSASGRKATVYQAVGMGREPQAPVLEGEVPERSISNLRSNFEALELVHGRPPTMSMPY